MSGIVIVMVLGAGVVAATAMTLRMNLKTCDRWLLVMATAPAISYGFTSVVLFFVLRVQHPGAYFTACYRYRDLYYSCDELYIDHRCGQRYRQSRLRQYR